MVSELEPCQLCGALPCDWVNDPHKTPTPDAGRLVDEYDIAAAVTNLAANVLKASGSNLKHYTMPSSKKAILSASMDGIEEAYRAGAEFVGSKYRATITAQAAEIARLRGLLTTVGATVNQDSRGMWHFDLGDPEQLVSDIADVVGHDNVIAVRARLGGGA